MKILCGIFSLFIFLTPAFADELAVSKPMIAANEVLRGKFTEERRLKDFKAPLRSTGHFVVAPGHGLIWVVETPFSITTVITPGGLVQEVDGTETMNLPAKRVPFLLHLYDMLSGTLAGDWGALSQQFSIHKTGNEQHWQVALSPLEDNPSIPFSAINASGGKLVEHIELIKPDGDSDELNFSNQKLSLSPLSKHELLMLSPKS